MGAAFRVSRDQGAYRRKTEVHRRCRLYRPRNPGGSGALPERGCCDRPGQDHWVVSGSHGVGTARTWEQIYHLRPETGRHEVDPQCKDQAAGVIQTLCAISAGGIGARMVRGRRCGSVHDAGLSDQAGEARHGSCRHSHRRFRSSANGVPRRQSPVLSTDRKLSRYHRRSYGAEHLIQRE